MNRAAMISLLAVLALGACACGAKKSSIAVSGSAARTQLTDLRDIDQLRAAFNTESKQPRLIVLVSPT
jgi:hypothetical protein